MSDATFEFNTDPAKAQQLAAERKQSMDTAKRSMTQEHRSLSEMDLLQQGIYQTRQKMQSRALRAMEVTQRGRLFRSIAAGGGSTGRSGRQGDLTVEGGGYGETSLPSASWQYHKSAEPEKQAASGLEKFVGGLGPASAALTGFSAALLTAGNAMRGSVDVKKSGYEESMDMRALATRAGQVLHMNPSALLAMMVESPDQKGGAALMRQLVQKAQLGGPRATARNVASAYGAVRRGATDFDTVSAGVQQWRWPSSRGGFGQGSQEQRYLDVLSGKNVAGWQALGGNTDQESKENSEFYDPAWKAFQQSHPFASSLPGWEALRTSRTLREARALRADYTDPSEARRSYDVTAQPGAVQSPIVGGGPDMSSGGRGSAATNAAIQHMARTITQAVGSRKPNSSAGTEP